MSERDINSFSHIRFDLIPIALVVPDFFQCEQIGSNPLKVLTSANACCKS